MHKFFVIFYNPPKEPYVRFSTHTAQALKKSTTSIYNTDLVLKSVVCPERA